MISSIIRLSCADVQPIILYKELSCICLSEVLNPCTKNFVELSVQNEQVFLGVILVHLKMKITYECHGGPDFCAAHANLPSYTSMEKLLQHTTVVSQRLHQELGKVGLESLN